MEENYEVFWGDEVVGHVAVSREGLYYRFCCRCKGLMSNMYHLTLNGQKLGILMPEGSWLRLETKVPIKRFGSEPYHFCLMPKHAPMEKGEFVPVYPEEPFAYLRRLENAVLEIRRGQTGVLLEAKKM